VHFTCWLRLVKFLLIICVWKKRITKAWLHFISPCYISCLLNTMFPLLFGFIAFFSICCTVCVCLEEVTLPSKNLIWHWGVYRELKEKWPSDGHRKVDNTKESIRWKKYKRKRKWKRKKTKTKQNNKTKLKTHSTKYFLFYLVLLLFFRFVALFACVWKRSFSSSSFFYLVLLFVLFLIFLYVNTTYICIMWIINNEYLLYLKFL
jgi:hypothetical protein